MITADTLKTLTSFTAPALTRAIQDAGYKKDSFSRAEFVGITNGGQFCYDVDYDDFGELTRGKVFLTYDPTVGRVSADY
jgi:hypothetical protein